MKDAQPSPPHNPAKRGLRLNKKLTVVLICFLISLIFWLLIALSHEYSAILTFPVNYVNFPTRKVVMNDLPGKIALNVKTSGFKILAYDFQKKKTPVEVDVSATLMSIPNVSDVLILPTRFFTQDFNRQLGNEINIVGFQPDSIVFYFSDRVSRKIPVQLNMELSFEKQYDTTGSPEINPSTITVSGPPTEIVKLKFLQTEKLSQTHVRETIKTNLLIPQNKLLTYETNSVEVTIPVEKFTEGVVEVPVRALNVQRGYVVKTFPDRVNVRYQVPMDMYNRINPSLFEVTVDASGIEGIAREKLDVTLVTSPAYVRATILEPGRVDFILRKQ